MDAQNTSSSQTENFEVESVNPLKLKMKKLSYSKCPLKEYSNFSIAADNVVTSKPLEISPQLNTEKDSTDPIAPTDSAVIKVPLINPIFQDLFDSVCEDLAPDGVSISLEFLS